MTKSDATMDNESSTQWTIDNPQSLNVIVEARIRPFMGIMIAMIIVMNIEGVIVSGNSFLN